MLRIFSTDIPHVLSEWTGTQLVKATFLAQSHQSCCRTLLINHHVLQFCHKGAFLYQLCGIKYSHQTPATVKHTGTSCSATRSCFQVSIESSPGWCTLNVFCSQTAAGSSMNSKMLWLSPSVEFQHYVILHSIPLKEMFIILWYFYF